ncbi:MAG: anaerobic ribonucleoside-triphosphate reductase activating protein [Candidatus Gracilibacteria bacterium]|nr:anaerobic ribonucleoside-triphosphate reductase activating protein [Candidatus Gracilibacteria bacterium]
MLISGIQKTTLLDYPSKVSCIIFTAGCNLRCSYCHNSEFVLPEKIAKIKDFIPELIFLNFLKTKIGILDGVVICGGEPTIQKDLVEFCKKIKDMGFLVKLDTNGQNPDILAELLTYNLVDYIAMDIKGDYENLENLLGIKYNKIDYLKSIEIIKTSGINYEFRTTIVKNYHTLENFEKVVKQIFPCKKYFLQNYRGGNTLNPNFNGESFNSTELLEFREIGVKYIENCEIRL